MRQVVSPLGEAETKVSPFLAIAFLECHASAPRPDINRDMIEKFSVRVFIFVRHERVFAEDCQ